MKATIHIEEALSQVLRETDLLSFQTKLAVEKQLTRLDHFQDVTDDELNSYGLSAPAIRRLRTAIERRRKLAKKAKLFGTKKEKFVTISASQTSPNHSQDQQASCSTACLIPRDEIKLMENIGEGTFAVVKRAIWRVSNENGSKKKVDCAVKILHGMSEQVRQDLFSEISNMQKLSHQNLVRLYGVVFNEPTLMVIEFCENGALLDRLRSQSKTRLLVTRLLNYGLQISNGMTYLEARGFVHRDLAARNVLLTENEEVVKICDFGLSRSLNENQRLYVMSGPKKVPFSWCPPESLRFRQFSHKSDVWAFGVTLWEIYTYGEEPYAGCKAVDVLRLTESGERLRMPEYCSKELYDIMNMCWNLSAESRPKFSHLRNLLQDVKFMTAVCREPTPKDTVLDEKCNSLVLEMDEKVILVSERNERTWFGQSVASRKFGTFQRNAVTLRSHRTSAGDHQQSGHSTSSAMQASGFPGMQPYGSSNNFHRREISHPIPGSWIHTGHGDTSEEKSWGYVDKIDEIYLRNPVTNNFASNRFSSQGVSFIPSVTALQYQKESSWSDHSLSGVLGQRRRSAQDLQVLPLQTDNASVKPITLPKPSRPHAAITSQHFANDHLFEMSSAVEPYQGITQQLAFPSTSWEAQSTTMPNTFRQDGRAKSETKMVEMRGNVSNGTTTEQTSKFATTLALTNNGNKMVGPPSRQQKSSKYDSTISVPRPQPNRSSPLLKQDIAFFAGTGSVSERIASSADQNVASSSLFSLNVSAAAPASSTSTASIGAASVKTSRQNNISGKQQPPPPFNKEPAVSSNLQDQPPLFIAERMQEEKRGNDPFVVDEQVKTLATKSRFNDFVPNGHVSTNLEKLSNTIANLKADHPVPVSTTHPIVSANSQISETANPAIASIIRPQSNGISTHQSAQGLPPTSGTSSFLPPPSELLLSGGSRLAGGSAGAYLQFTGASSGTAGNGVSFGVQQSGVSSGTHYQPIFDLQQHRADNSKIRYGTNGIPILEPTPAPPVFPSHMALESKTVVKPMIIDLKDLDTDALIARVQSQVDFASPEQCRLFLRKHNFDVENAVRELKIEKLLEIGVAGDRHLAASALDSCKWNVNAAANHLVS